MEFGNFSDRHEVLGDHEDSKRHRFELDIAFFKEHY